MRNRSSRRMRPAAALPLLVAAASCTVSGSDSLPDPDAAEPTPDGGGVKAPNGDAGSEASGRYDVRAVFEPTAVPMPFGAVPWPDDLYRDEKGGIRLETLPGDISKAAGEAILQGLQELAGFSAVAPVFFRFDGAVDPASLPADRRASTRPGTSVFLMDIDPSSPTAFTRIPIETHWHAQRQQLALRPALGEPLVPGRRYAAVITDGVVDEQQNPVGPAEPFAELRDSPTAPQPAALRRAYDQYAPVLDALAGIGVPRERIVALATFRVQALGSALKDARASLRAQESPAVSVTGVVSEQTSPTLDEALGMPESASYGLTGDGVQHANLGWMVHGTLPGQSFLSRTAGAHGRFERNESGQLVVKRQASIPFTLCLPRATAETVLEDLPVLLFQHGLGAERSDVLAVADALTAAGYAVLAIDAPFHGLRAARTPSDVTSRFVAREGPDFFGDARGVEVAEAFVGLEGESPGLPLQWRDAMYQSVVDLMAAVLVLEEGDWSALKDLDPELESLSFTTDRIGYVGVDLGGQLGVMLMAEEPSIGSAALVTTGMLDAYGIVESPKLSALSVEPMFEALGMDANTLDYDADHPRFRPEVAIWQTLLERGTPALYAPIVRKQAKPILLLQARDDEAINNLSGEAFGQALGAQFAGGMPRYVPMAQAEVQTGTTHIGSNVETGDRWITRVLLELAPATHSLLYESQGRSTLEHPVRARFEEKPEVAVDNPIDEAIMQMSFFFESWREGAARVTAP